MLIKKETESNITIYHVDKDIPDNKVKPNTFVNPKKINLIIRDDADVYTTDGTLLLRFRKQKLTKPHINLFYENIIKFALLPSSNRGSASGSTTKNVATNKKIMTNIFGYIDGFSPKQKYTMKRKHQKIKLNVRECRFNRDFPELYKQCIPLIQDIDKYYKQYLPDKYEKQYNKSKQTYFKIANTAFTTVTTNVNFQTFIHKDTGDDSEGFGNLVVIENGKYHGGETCFPQYGIGVDVRSGDVLFMNVHEWHGNLPIKGEDKTAKRISIVCYLREKVWNLTKNKTKKEMIRHNKTVKNLMTSKS
jgi:hypothetical protein